MKGNEIRKRFIDYFEKQNHTRVESSSLVPQDDPTLLFVNAGMVQFKTVFMGEDKREYTRAVTCQRCVRAGGKHNDLENVGYTARHHTFFEMLGNFSFGDYFKEDAIRFAWEFLVKELAIPAEQLWVSVFTDDDEAYALWEKIEELPQGRIVRLGEKDNFWAMGDTGPCGPCSEIHIDQGVEAGCGRPDCAVGCDCDRFLELWNLVFMQFNRSEDGTMTSLPRPSIDTGMGLERVAAVLQGKFNNYDSDLFQPIIQKLEELSGRKYRDDEADTTAMRVIADHARATTFLVADGILPSNEGRGYVLRRVMRRAIRYGRNLGLAKPFMAAVTDVVAVSMTGAYPHLRNCSTLLAKVVNSEEQRFSETLEHGLILLDEEVGRLAQAGEREIKGDFIFKLYDTFGFPVDIVRDISLERGVKFDAAGFTVAMDKQRAQSRSSRKGEGVRLLGEGVKELIGSGKRSVFIGYEQLAAEATILGLLNGEGKVTERLPAGATGSLFVDCTPFYAESGGQDGDKGQVTWEGGKASIQGTRSEGEGIILHAVQITEGTLETGSRIHLQVTESERGDTAANHTATHLLQAALRELLGEHIKQAGSLVTPTRLRFDFTHFSPLTLAEIQAIEKRVNRKIRENVITGTTVVDREQAIEEGATALFGEKYGESVRVVTVGEFSKELCGGTHVAATGEIGLFQIVTEAGIAAGIRRIEAVTGRRALARVQGQVRREKVISEILGVQADGIEEKLQALIQTNKRLDRQVAELSTQLASSELGDLLAAAVEVEGVKVVAAVIPLDSPKTLREVGDRLRDDMGSGVAVLGGAIAGKAALLAIVSKDLTSRIKAGALINKVAALVGGKGGGRPDMAQAGGTMPDKLGEAIASVEGHVRSLLAE
ncbi:MAG: alanine--tRNA ligase [Proteobacteria bacterium]|nr:alanine--tRNA ligase [Pseudomonadota bacterium]MBU1060145.1 alanine--tRNA ligase [Pseudomonadota bacterium]